MSNPTGMDFMIHYHDGGYTHEPKEYYGLKITSVEFTEKSLNIGFENGKTIKLWDYGQTCCENRYMTTDDDVKSLIGHRLTRIDPNNVKVKKSEWGDEHEATFIEIGTNQNFITIVTHNEHNGYYGGFCLAIDEVSP